MLLADLERVLDSLAPFSLAEPWDNSGLQVGDRAAPVRRVLVALDLTPDVLNEATAGEFEVVLTHHPLIFSPLHSLSESRPRERLIRRAVTAQINVVACHTNLDSARGGIADMVAEALGVEGAKPLQPASPGWYKFVGFIPPDAVAKVADAVFASGAGVIGDYSDCAFALTGEGWFTPRTGAHPSIGQLDLVERTPEVRWETVLPKARLKDAIWAYFEAHPYEEPAFNVFPVEDIRPDAGLGRIGELSQEETVGELAARMAAELRLPYLSFAGDAGRPVKRVALLPGSGRSLLQAAAGRADVFVTGDTGYHDSEAAQEAGMALISAPHGELEWYGMRRWVPALASRLAEEKVLVEISKQWRSPWQGAAPAATSLVRDKCAQVAPNRARLYVDGGSRGNPGASAIGVVLEDESGRVITEIGRAIGIATNNVAEYQALLTGLESAREQGIRSLAVFSDSELLVRQIEGRYQVKNEGLKPLYRETLSRLEGFDEVTVEHVSREKNREADRLVNEALDEAAADSPPPT